MYFIVYIQLTLEGQWYDNVSKTKKKNITFEIPAYTCYIIYKYL